MKRTYANRPDWKRVYEKRYRAENIEDDFLNGYLSIIHIDKVSEPLVLKGSDKKIYLADDGYIWIQYFPKNENFALTTMFNKDHEIIQLYYDICSGNYVDDFGVPYYDDLYLDVVLLPSGEIRLLDEDELNEALVKNEITNEQFNMANAEAQRIIEFLKERKKEALENSKKYLEYMLVNEVV